MSKAGDNEKLFKSLINKQFNFVLDGKQTFKDDSVSISVDESIIDVNHKILIEIDSGNYAKLLVGQYTLLNTLIEDRKNYTFIIIHYYKNSNGKLYNSERTRKNIELVNKKIFNHKGIKFKCFNVLEFKNIIKNLSDINELKNMLR